MTYIALLRGINVGGNNMVPMAALREAVTALGFTGVTTLLQSGNVVFQGTPMKPPALEARLEKAIETRFKVRADFHVRTPDEWNATVASNPFQREAEADPARLIVTFFRERLDPARVASLQAAITGPERVGAAGRELFMTYPDGMGRSKAAALVEKTLGVRGTARNWNTITRLAALAAGGD